MSHRLPFRVSMLKSAEGKGYKVITYDEFKVVYLDVSPYLPRDKAVQIMEGFGRAGYKIEGTRHEVDMI